MSTVSVILTTYNRDRFLPEAIQSILAQDYQDFELFLIDDGSTDNTWKKIQPYHHLLTYIRHTSNKGISAARNTGIRNSSGKLICFLDSDDLWENKKLSSQITFLQKNSGYQIVYTNETWLRDGSWLNQKSKHKKFSGYIFDKLLPLCLISASSIMVSRQILDQTGYFDESFPACEDYDLWLRIGCRFPIGYLEDRLIIKRGGHKDQLSQKYVGLDKLRIKALLKVISQGDLTSLQMKAAKEALKKKCGVYGSGCLHHQKEDERTFFLSIPEKIDSKIGTDDFQKLLQSPFFLHHTLKETENAK